MSLAEQFVDRSLADRHEAVAAEVRRLIDAAFAVIGETGHLDPPVRAILAEAGLSNQVFYRHFRSKDELLLVMLDEGRHRLVRYLDDRMARVSDDAPDAAAQRVSEWIRGVLAQAVNPDAARRTRPFVVGVERLQAEFPEEQAASEQQLVSQLAAVAGDRGVWAPTIYALVMGELARYLRFDTPPSAADVERVVRFALAGAATPFDPR